MGLTQTLTPYLSLIKSRVASKDWILDPARAIAPSKRGATTEHPPLDREARISDSIVSSTSANRYARHVAAGSRLPPVSKCIRAASFLVAR